jgi:hypothetical protein
MIFHAHEDSGTLNEETLQNGQRNRQAKNKCPQPSDVNTEDTKTMSK